MNCHRTVGGLNALFEDASNFGMLKVIFTNFRIFQIDS